MTRQDSTGRPRKLIEEPEPSVKDKLLFPADIIRDAKTGKAYAQ